jgi:hypothetical protein
MRNSVDKGRRTEQEIARLLTQWATPLYLFQRRGLGHAGQGDLVVTAELAAAPWPFTISIKSQQGPTLAVMLARAHAGLAWPWWRELEATDEESEIMARRMRAWLIWRSGFTWMLSVWTLGALQMPVRLALLPPPLYGWPRFTIALKHFLQDVTIDDVVKAIVEGWGQP